MFSICILEGNKDVEKNKSWLFETLDLISTYQKPKGKQRVLASFKAENITKEHFFFTLSHPNYLKLNNKKIFFSNKSIKAAHQLFSESEIQQVKFPKADSFLCIRGDTSITTKNFAIESIPKLKELLPYHVLLFHNLEHFNQFSAHMDHLCKDENSVALLDKLKKLRSANFQLQEEIKWNKTQAEVLQTSLSLIRTEYQNDLNWYKDELEKVIQWYKKNHEELPPGISRLGKGINVLRKRLRLRRKLN